VSDGMAQLELPVPAESRTPGAALNVTVPATGPQLGQAQQQQQQQADGEAPEDLPC
jgi:hypothetical protein